MVNQTTRMNEETWLVGVDGGGSKTEIVLCDLGSGRSASAVGGASNPNTVGHNQAMDTITALVETGLAEVGAARDAVVAMSLCLSGVDRQAQVSAVLSSMRERFPAARIEVTNDAMAALSAGTAGESGIVVIAGTGSIAVGEDWHGHTARAGGYGSLIGDEGGGYDIGRQGLMAAIQAAEGRGPATSLWQNAAEVFRLREPGELIPAVYGSPHPVGTVASFARHVLAAAHGGDAVAQRIVADSGRQLAQMVASVWSQLKGEVGPTVVLAGGLLQQTDVLRNEIAAHLERDLPDVALVPLSERPAVGAVWRARRLVSAVKGEPSC